MYQAKSLSNRLYLKEQSHTLCMDESKRISMSVINGIILDLQGIGVAISNKDKSLPASYEHMKSILLYVKDTLIYLKVTNKLLSEERRLDNEKNVSIAENALMVNEGEKKNSGKRVCWTC